MSHVVQQVEPAVQVNELAAGPARFDPPPRRVWAWRVPGILDAGLHGRPIVRHLTISTLGLLLALLVVAPDLAYGLFPVYDLTVVDSTPRTLPAYLDVVSERIPEGLLGYSATFRLPAGGVRSGPIDAAEYAAIQAGNTTMKVHVSGGDFPRGWPVSGRFEQTRMAAAGVCLVFALAFGARLVLAMRKRWWMVKLARKGQEIVGRVTEVNARHLVRNNEEPVGWLYDVFYEFAPTSSAKQGSVQEFQSGVYHPFAVGEPIRILYLDEKRPLSIPADFLPTKKTIGD